ncbi:ABC transporter permease [Rhodopirellula sp. MGV]|uniref:ABC transporter permease n=1 Tax=Rhodopirellula sp. MGV TaxID=2023130 RepID=UPI000B95FBE3|nr:ABC transporter permease [Rhodopirellula sp. MGV]OYP36112.1 ABC transporter ATP-binding protein [Rhodopirellula sp. MGV]PNY36528.1 ABC transporter ATP-binding protein [Rhodopirellula baltica]
MTDSVIQVSGLSRSFGDLVAVDGVSFDVRRGAIFGLLGPNGSGKSTIIRMLLGVLPPSSGTATVLGYNAINDAERIKSRVGYMSQHFSLYADLSVQENIDFYGRIYGLENDELDQRRAAVLELTSLESQTQKLAGTLSGGWQRRLALACALIHQPDVLFLDEPTAGIDPVARRQLWDLLFELSGRGVTLFVTTHYMDEAERCSDVGYIYLSKLLVLGKPDELKSLPHVTPEGTKRVEIRVPAPAEKLHQLRDDESVHDATLFGETIHALVDETVNPSQLRSLLNSPDDQIDVRPITPSLEDVFVTLTQDAERQRLDNESDGSDASEFNSATSRTDAESEAGHQVSSARQPAARQPATGASMIRGWWAILVKEFFHIRRQPTTLFFMFVVPVMQTIIFGYAIDTQIENIPMVLFDMDQHQQSRRLVSAFLNTRKFRLEQQVNDTESFERALTSGNAKVGLRIPPFYSERLLRGEQVQVQVLIDGSDSQVATTAMNTAQLLGITSAIEMARTRAEALQVAPSRDRSGHAAMPLEVRSRILYNPDLESSHFFVPGLVGIILQLVTLFLTSFAIVREREQGTLEQLFVTPVSRGGLLLGKLLPYAAVGFAELLLVLTVMVYGFGVPINGSLTLLLIFSMMFMICSLSLGLLVSTIAKTQLEAIQLAFIVMLPSVLLSGFMFPRSEMPLPIYLATFGIPVTYFIDILRGIVLRGADWADLIPSVFGLLVCGTLILFLSVLRFQKRQAV